MRTGKLIEIYDYNIDHAVMINFATWAPDRLTTNLNPYREKPQLTDEQKEIRRKKDTELGMKLMEQGLRKFCKNKKRKK